MASVIVEPFEVGQDEILQVRRLLFHPNPLTSHAINEATVQQGYERISVWLQRSNVPIAVIATSILVKPLIPGKPEITEPQAAHAKALADFVSAYIDNQQKWMHKKSSFDIAKSIGLPDSYVALRHDIVHGETPPLAQLRRFVVGALRWVYQEYWKGIDVEPLPAHVESSSKKVNADERAKYLRICINDYTLKTTAPMTKRERYLSVRQAPAAPGVPQENPREIILQVAKEIRSIYDDNDEDEDVAVLVDHILKPDRMVPGPTYAHRPGFEQGDAMVYQWWPFVECLVKAYRTLLPVLLEHLTLYLARSSVKGGLPEREINAVIWWIEFFFKDSRAETLRKQRRVPCKTVLSLCLAYPGPATNKIAISVYESEYFRSFNSAFERDNLAELKVSLEGLCGKEDTLTALDRAAMTDSGCDSKISGGQEKLLPQHTVEARPDAVGSKSG